MEIPSFKQDLRALIEKALKAPYTSRSCKESIETGNHYQSIDLGDTRTAGFRADRAGILDQIGFRGKKVLDLGSNLGEISRAARKRGAWLVDGYEYDPYFIEIANAINAHNDVSRVSFYQKDVTDPGIYREHFDIVLAFSVFTYIEKVLPQIAAITAQLLVVETHKVENNLEAGYLAPVLKHFRYYQILGRSDWGTPFEGKGERAVIAFAKEEHHLRKALTHLAPGESFWTSEHQIGRPPVHSIDVARTSFLDPFFESIPAGIDPLAHIELAPLTLDGALGRADLKDLLYSGITYWSLFLKGYSQFCANGSIGPGNIYYDYMIGHYVPGQQDPDLCLSLPNPAAIVARIAQRFRDMDLFKNGSDRDATAAGMTPLQIYTTDPPPLPEDALRVFLTDTQSPLIAARIDGWHRLFAARLFGAKAFPAMLIEERAIPAGATVAVISKGDDSLLDLGAARHAWHFPQSAEGWYAGHHPANSQEAIDHLETVRARGAQFLLVPKASAWWLDHYTEFRDHLESRYRKILDRYNSRAFFDLR